MSDNRKCRGSRPVILCALVAVVLSGCVVRSVAPVVAKEDRELDSRLVGSWRAEDGKQAVITAADSDFHIVYTDEHGNTGLIAGRLGRLGALRVLDLSPEESGVTANDLYKGLLLPLHTFLVIDSLGAELRLRGLDPDSLKAFLKREPAAVAHLDVEDADFLLTAPTPRLRAFLERFAARPGVLGEVEVWKRQ